VTVSLDTLRPERFRALTRRDGHERVLAGLEALRAVGFTHTKIDSVILRGTNDDELVDLIEHGKRVEAEVRFIEYMDVGGATRWSMAEVLPRREILERVRAAYGPPTPVVEDGSAPGRALPAARRHGLRHHRLDHRAVLLELRPPRLTADGMWYLCLYARIGTDLRKLLRGGASQEALAAEIARIWAGRSDRGAEERLAEHERGALVPRAELVRDPHLEMHSRGG
jgi:cyclic pyranopterin phosphate synthase